jgi:hypothetical protein
MPVKGIDIFEQIGVVLIGFVIYDAAYSEGTSPLLPEGSFGWLRAMTIVILCLMIAISLLISHRGSSETFTENVTIGDPQFQNHLRQATQGKGRSMYLGAALAAAALLLAYVGLGEKQAFLLWLGFGFVNFGPLASSLEKRL